MAVIHSEAPPVHRSERRNLWFAVASLGLLVVSVWMMYADYNREWKAYQREFRRIEVERARKRIGELDAKYQNDRNLQKLAADLKAAQDDLAAKQGDLAQAEAGVKEADRKFFLAETEWKVSKSYYDAFKYGYEEAVAHGRGVPHAEKAYRDSEARYQKAVTDLAVVNKEKAAAYGRRKSLRARADEAQRKIDALTEARSRLQKKVEAIGPSLANDVRNRPLLDYMNPSLKIQQVQLPNLFNDVNFLKVPKVDRCMTCHLAAGEKGYEEAAQPFRSHPGLDLFIDPSSKHPVDQFGCTTCHQGLDRATWFASAQHTPSDAEERHAWEKTYDWYEPHHWDNPMLPLEHTEAACLKCHKQEVRVTGAPRLNRALDQLERAGCFGCHKIQGSESLRKSGPDLAHIAAKTTKDWAYSWVMDPRAYRPTTWMPKFFGLSNTSDPDDQARSGVEADAILSYIWARSQPLPMDPPPVRGEASRGARLVRERGCLGCHRIGENPTARGTYGRDFGPALDRVGDKVGETWLYHWIRDPKKYFPGTFMPDLRLTDAEAADVAAYLMTLRRGDAPPAPPVDEAILSGVVKEFLLARETEADASARVASMSLEEKRVFAGERLISRYGCFGCHNIPGFEKALPIGTELTQEGSKLVTRLDFGYVHLEHTRQDWFFQKLKEPRIFDRGKVKTRQEKLKMPDFGFTDEEASVMVTLLLGLVKDEPMLETVKRLDERGSAVEAGRRIVQQHNCRGCHVIEGQGGSIRETIEDPGLYPPMLSSQGAKVQSDWLFAFLKGPVPIRPWLGVRMPTFGFNDAEAITIGRYFAAQDDVLYPFVSEPETPVPAAQLAEGKRWFTELKCLQCHVLSDSPAAGLSAADLAPNLSMARTRLRRDWIAQWLKDPQKLMPGTRMPSFFYSDGEPLMEDPDAKILSIRDYLMTLGEPEGRRGGALRASGAAGDRPGL